jgi:hypothetical protein
MRIHFFETRRDPVGLSLGEASRSAARQGLAGNRLRTARPTAEGEPPLRRRNKKGPASRIGAEYGTLSQNGYGDHYNRARAGHRWQACARAENKKSRTPKCVERKTRLDPNPPFDYKRQNGRAPKNPEMHWEAAVRGTPKPEMPYANPESLWGKNPQVRNALKQW